MKKLIMVCAATLMLLAFTAVTGKTAELTSLGSPTPSLDAIAYDAISESVLWNFSVPEGYQPFAGLIMDKRGNLYGTTAYGGTYDCFVEDDCFGGTAFELTPPLTARGSWTESILWNFGNGQDGAVPKAGLLMDERGNLYGTTSSGGAYGTDAGGYFPENGGTVFKLSPPSGRKGSWTESVLWSFGNGADGTGPTAGLIVDAIGNLYGTTFEGGAYGGGTAFKLKAPWATGGEWTESILWEFGNGNDGSNPYSNLIMDKRGNLYGTTINGGPYHIPFDPGGTAFELTPPSTYGGGWTESILWNFGLGNDGFQVIGGLISDADGNLYGTTFQGGLEGEGTAFELTPPSTYGGSWTESILWNFGNGSDGTAPGAGLLMDKRGNLYGTTQYGGTNTFGGTAFVLRPPSTSWGSWNESILWDFGNGTDGLNPIASLIADSRGILYSTTIGGGENGEGTVFELSLP